MIFTNRVTPVSEGIPPLFQRRSASTLSASTHDKKTQSFAVSDSNTNNLSLHVPQRQFTLLWLAYVFVSISNATLTLLFAAIYCGALIVRGGYMIEAVGLMALEYIPFVIVSYTVMALYFWKAALEAIFASICLRRLVFHYPRRKTSHKRISRWSKFFHRFCPTKLAFEVVFLMRETLEVSTQSYQAYKCSKLISMQWINNFYVGTLALNCWVSPLIHIRVTHNPPLQRFLYICSDVVLDFASTFVVPISIISTVVVTAFRDNLGSMSGDMEVAFDVPMSDVKFSNMIKAIQQVFVVTWLDFITKLLPFVSMASCLNIIKHLVQRHPRKNEKNLHKREFSTADATALVQTDSQPQRHHPDVVHLQSRPFWVRHTARFARYIVSVHTVHTIFAVWGVCIIAFHYQAHHIAAKNTLEHSIGCKTRSQPWFVDKFSCTVLEINCYRRDFTGHVQEIVSALDHVDSKGIGTLIISHCPRLYIPREIQTLSNLMWLEIFNATLIRWDEDAALINSKLPALQYLNLIRVNMTELPPGVQSNNFPSRLRDITITLCNITTLPDDLHTKWKKMVNLVLERNLLDALPATISKMNPSRLSVFRNNIDRIPDDFFTRDADFWILSVAMNPIAKWPATIGSLDRVYLVLMDYTEIAELPAWLTDEGARRARANAAGITVSAGGSTFCRANRQRTADGLHIVCREKVDMEIEAYMMSYYAPSRQP